ncbi:butyrophilin-like protein 10 [Simochromis diagramma]|uniref:butyrophilin-like protein 10 n=1 Tax=Simochromis diagramma TaxID=43689 RepID=UPI001A7E3B27|nr:butyrophilin-like protein 10 [Simochromis diagramma]
MPFFQHHKKKKKDTIWRHQRKPPSHIQFIPSLYDLREVIADWAQAECEEDTETNQIKIFHCSDRDFVLIHPPCASWASYSVSLWILILCFVLVKGKSHLVCPSQVVAMLGDDVVLPCQLKFAVDTNAETVNWIKPGLDPDVVHLHKDGRLVFENQNPSYHFRTRVFVDELMKGNVSLKIFNVKLSDEGTYRCSIPWIREEASIVLTVGSASTPVIKVMSNISSRVVLQCESAGWYPKPELLWLDGEGNLLSAGPTETLRGPEDLYTVSSRVTVEKRHSNKITCRVQQRNTNQSRETHKHVPGEHISDSTLISCIGVGAAFLMCIIVMFVTWKLKEKQSEEQRNTKQSTETHIDVPDHMNDGCEQTEEENNDITLFDNNQTVTSTQGLLESEKRWYESFQRFD